MTAAEVVAVSEIAGRVRALAVCADHLRAPDGRLPESLYHVIELLVAEAQALNAALTPLELWAEREAAAPSANVTE